MICGLDFGGSSGDDNMTSIAIDSDSNIYVAGSFRSSSFTMGSYTIRNSGSSDIVVAKLSSSGTVMWASSFGGSGDDQALGIAADTYNVYVTGYYRSSSMTMGSYTLSNSGNRDIFLAKLSSSSGSVVYAEGYGSSSADYATAIAVDSRGSAVMTGAFSSSMTMESITLSNSGKEDIFISRVPLAVSNKDRVFFPPSQGGPLFKEPL